MADAFNKFAKQSAGTLVGNWHEERELRETTGHGRNYPIHHVPRHQGEPEYTRNRDGTDKRIHGTEYPLDSLNSYNSEYGTSKNPADLFPKTGRREQLLAEQIRNEIQNEVKMKLEQEKLEKEARIFETTAKTTFSWKKTEEKIGKRVMRDQNGKEIQLSDPEFAYEHGFRKIQPITDVKDLQEEVKSREDAITLHSESLPRATVPVSISKGANPFARTSGFTQPVQLTRGANSFQGNI